MFISSTTQFEQPLLRTKISIPQTPSEFVQRPRLTERINQGVKGPLTLLTASAGYGKTNLLIEWAKNTHNLPAWLTLDRQDNDLVHFFRYLVAALQSLEPQVGDEALEFIQSTKGSGLEVGLTLLINEITTLPNELVIILDEFQNLDDPAILQGIAFLLKHLPPNLHLVLASRYEPPLNLASMRAKGKVVELSTEDLRFRREEIGEYFQQFIGVQLPEETILALERRTDGWITALQMAALSLQHQSDPVAVLDNLQGDAHYLVDFLAEEVLDRQPDEIRQFLLRSSILDTLTGPLCEAVVQPDAQPGYGMVMLDRLEHANLFITALDEKHEWFRYHLIFADFLRHIHEEINPAEIPELHKRAVLWFEENANLDEAFRHALAINDMEWAANVIERNSQTMIKAGEISSLTRWISKLPEEIIHQHPHLSIVYAWGLIVAYQPDQACHWLDEVQNLLEYFNDQNGKTPILEVPSVLMRINQEDLPTLHGEFAICESALAIMNSDLEQASEFSREAALYLKKENPFIHSLLALDDSYYFILSGNTDKAINSLQDTIRIARQANNLLVQIIAICQLAETQALQGQLSQALVTSQKAEYIALRPDGTPFPLAGLIDVGIGKILLERNELDEAHDFLERGYQSTRSLWSISGLDALVSLARLHQAIGEISVAQEIIAEASQMTLSIESSQWDDVAVCTLAVKLALQRNDLETAQQWWQKGKFPELNGTIPLEKYPYIIFENLILTQARFLLVQGDASGNLQNVQQALELLEMLSLESVRLRRITSQIEIFILMAMAQSALKNDRAKKTMLCALALGEPEGFRRIYLDEGLRLLDLLLQCRSAQPDQSYHLPSLSFIDELIKTIQSESDVRQLTQLSTKQPVSSILTKETEGLIPLSAREMDVLTLIAEGKSNQEISAQLYLALNTVKRHAYNIYTKLEVKNRTQAVSKARQLGLIP